MLHVHCQTQLKMEDIKEFPSEELACGKAKITKEEQMFKGLLFALEEGYNDLAELLINEVG